MKSKRKMMLYSLIGCLALVPVLSARAAVPGVITTTDGRKLEGSLRWMSASKRYEVTLSSSQVVLQVTPQQVRQIDVKAPDGLKGAVDAVRRGNPDAAIPTLNTLAENYSMLQWDVTATRWLAEAYLQKGDPAAALGACNDIVRDRPEMGYASELAATYWQALLQTERLSTLERMLDEVMSTGTREMVSRALIMRGDLLKSRGELKDALKDGYLRVVMLMKAESAVQPEALFKAMRCFEELGQANYAERMRSALMDQYGESDYARRVATGG